jgi:hypothetical protein
MSGGGARRNLTMALVDALGGTASGNGTLKVVDRVTNLRALVGGRA